MTHFVKLGTELSLKWIQMPKRKAQIPCMRISRSSPSTRPTWEVRYGMFVGIFRKWDTARGQCESQVHNSIKRLIRFWKLPPIWRIVEQCFNSEMGAVPTSVANCTLSSCSFCVVFSTNAWPKATETNQLERGSALKSPPQSSCPAVTTATINTNSTSVQLLNSVSIGQTFCRARE